MNAMNNISMNGSHPFDQVRVKNEKSNSMLKELLYEKEERVKDLSQKNERMEKELLKLQIGLKTSELKLKEKMEKDYKTNTNTSSNFLLPSEFKKLWEDFANKNLSDCYIDFYENPTMSFNLIQEILILSLEMFRDQLKSTTNQIMSILNIPPDKNNYKQIEISLKTVYQEYFTNIFDSEKNSENFFLNVKRKYENFVNELPGFNKENEFEELITSKCFKDLICIIKKILLYIEFHDPPLKLKIDSLKERKIEIKKYKNSDCICVEGLAKENKNCMILLYPPVLKNGFVYNGLKPIVLVYEGLITPEMIYHHEEEKVKEKDKYGESNLENTLDSKRLMSAINETFEKKIGSTDKDNLTSLFTKNQNVQEKVINISDNSIGTNLESKITVIKEIPISPIKAIENEIENIPNLKMKGSIPEQTEKSSCLETNLIDSVEEENKSNFNDTHSVNKNLLNSIDFNDYNSNSNNTPPPGTTNLKNINYRSISHHNFFPTNDKFCTTTNPGFIENPNPNPNLNLNQNPKPNPNPKPNLKATIIHYDNSLLDAYNKNERNNNNNNNNNNNTENFGGMINVVNGSFKDGDHMLRSYEKIEDLIQTSRSNFESNNEELVNFEHLENYVNEMEYEIASGDYHHYNNKSSLGKQAITSLSNSFAKNVKHDMMSTMNLVSMGGLNFDRDNLSNASETLNQTLDKEIKRSNLTSNMLINNSDKKLGKNMKNIYMYQSSERGGLDLNSLTKTIEKLGRKVNPLFYKSGGIKTTIRSLSKTPKHEDKARIVGYSPRNNTQYIFKNNNEKQNNNNNIIIKVGGKKSINPRFSNNFVLVSNGNEEKKRTSSKTSSVSKERYINNVFQPHKTIEEDNLHSSSKQINVISPNNPKYKEFKGKFRLGNNNYIVSAVKGGINQNINNLINNPNVIQIKNNSNTSYTKQNDKPILSEKVSEENLRKKVINREGIRNQSSNKKPGKSIDRRQLTNAQTKICVDELLSFKKNEKLRGSPLNVAHKERNFINNNNNNNNNENKTSKTNFLNIKYA